MISLPRRNVGHRFYNQHSKTSWTTIIQDNVSISIEMVNKPKENLPSLFFIWDCNHLNTNNLLPVYVMLLHFSILNSDGLSHSAKRLSESHRLDLLRNITELLGRTFPSQFVFPVLGHEDVQNNDYKDYKSFLLSLGNIWKQWLPLEALQTFEKGNRRNHAIKFIIYCFTAEGNPNLNKMRMPLCRGNDYPEARAAFFWVWHAITNDHPTRLVWTGSGETLNVLCFYISHFWWEKTCKDSSTKRHLG